MLVRLKSRDIRPRSRKEWRAELECVLLECDRSIDPPVGDADYDVILPIEDYDDGVGSISALR